MVTESTPQGKQTDYLVFEAPDKLGGYVQSGNKRTYVYVIGDTEYQSLTVSAGHLHQEPGVLPAAEPGGRRRSSTRPTTTCGTLTTAKNIQQTTGTPTRSP